MNPRIEIISEKILVGFCTTMSFKQDKTLNLWSNFMPRRKEIVKPVNTNLYSMQIYPKSFDSNPLTKFEKWAAMEISNHNNIPSGMNSFKLPKGLYAIFIHKGSITNQNTFRYIFEKWLPNSNYVLDNRPHFEILGKKYKHNNPDSEEEVYIPIQPKTTLHQDK